MYIYTITHNNELCTHNHTVDSFAFFVLALAVCKIKVLTWYMISSFFGTDSDPAIILTQADSSAQVLRLYR